MNRLINVVILFVMVLSSVLYTSTVWAEPRKKKVEKEKAVQQLVLVPDVARIKIDSVDASGAPEMRIRATMLGPDGTVPSPNQLKIDVLEVSKKSTNALEKGLVPIVFNDTDAPIDLAVVTHFSDRLSEDDRTLISDTLTKLVEMVTGRNEEASVPDRMAGLFDTGVEIHDGVTDENAKDAVLTILQTPEQFAAHLGNVAAAPLGKLSFLYSGINRAINALSDVDEKNRPGYEKARRAVLVITDGYDSFAYKQDDVQDEIQSIVKQARDEGITIYVVSHNFTKKSLEPLFEGMSRKTGGTFRRSRYKSNADCNRQGSLCYEVLQVWGELIGQYIIDFRHSTLNEGNEVQYALMAHCISGTGCEDYWREAESTPSAPTKIEKINFNWALFQTICFILVILLIIGAIVFLIRRKIQEQKELEEAAREEQELAEKIEKGEVCPKCHRTLMADWKECMFCAREAQEEIAKAKEAEKAKAAEEAKKKGEDPAAAAAKDKGAKVCPACGRTMPPQWKECLFCKAGIGGEGGPKKGLAPAAEKAKKEAAPEGRVCPDCGRPMKPNWVVCLYCEADGNNRPAPSSMPKPEEPKGPAAPAAPAVRTCPDCGRPMKAHWATCLYCEANKAR